MTDNTKTSEAHEAHEAYVANRREAGRVIDIETCEIIVFYCNSFDPYESYPFDDDPPIMCHAGTIGRHFGLFAVKKAMAGYVSWICRLRSSKR